MLKRVVCISMILVGCSARAEGVRKPILAGQWYSADRKALAAVVDGYMEKATVFSFKTKPVGLVCPHAGYTWSGAVAGHAYRLLKGHSYKRVIVLAPAHHVAPPGASILDVTHYETPLGRVPLDRKVCDALLKDRNFETVPEAHAREHSIEIQLPFLQRVLKDFELVPIVVGRPTIGVLRDISAAVARHVDDNTLVVASSDFTHYGGGYGYVPFKTDIPENLKKLDMGAVEFILGTDPDGFYRYQRNTRATICGAAPIFVLLSIFSEGCRGELVKYDTSGRKSGDFSQSVSYVAAGVFKEARKDAKAAVKKAIVLVSDTFLGDAEQKTLVGISRKVLESWVKTETRFTVDSKSLGITAPMRAKRGVFVTLKNGKRLRGCIGYIVGRTSVLDAVISNTINSCQDPRFRDDPVTESELGQIEISISVMSELIRVKDVNEINVGRDGLVIQKDGRSGVLLPQVPVEQGWDRDRFLEGICWKAGLPAESWKSGATLWRFSAQVFGEKEAVKK